MLLDPSYLVFLQTLAASIYADGDSYHRCRACMCGRDYYTHIHFAMDYADYLSNMFLSSEWRGHYPYYREDCRDYCDDIFFFGAWNFLVLVPMVHLTGMLLYDRLLYGFDSARYRVPVGYQKELYAPMAETITSWRSKL